MEVHDHFTCIAYDSVDFLIQSRYVISGMYLEVDKEANSLVFNRETLPHIHIGGLLESTFSCAPAESYNVVIVMRNSDFDKEVRGKIIDYTDTAFPASGSLALSVNAAISSNIIALDSLRLPPLGIREKLFECGICAVSFNGGGIGRTQLLVSPDMLLRKFFSTGALKLKARNRKI